MVEFLVQIVNGLIICLHRRRLTSRMDLQNANNQFKRNQNTYISTQQEKGTWQTQGIQSIHWISREKFPKICYLNASFSFRISYSCARFIRKDQRHVVGSSLRNYNYPSETTSRTVRFGAKNVEEYLRGCRGKKWIVGMDLRTILNRYNTIFVTTQTHY